MTGPYERRRDRALALASATPGYARPLSPERQDRPETPWMRHGRSGLGPYTRQARRAREREEEREPMLSHDLRYWLSERPLPGRWGLRISGRFVRVGHSRYLGWRLVY